MAQEGGIQDRADDRRDWELLHEWSGDEQAAQARYDQAAESKVAVFDHRAVVKS